MVIEPQHVLLHYLLRHTSTIMAGIWRRGIDPQTDNGPMILASCGTMTALAGLTVMARIYTRGWLAHGVDKDDYTMWLAMALSLVAFAVVIPDVMSGAGRYEASLPPQTLKRSILLQFVTQLLYLWAILFVKVSITFCLLRFSPSKNFSRFLWSCMAFFVVTASIYFGALLFQCQPVSALWDSTINGACLSPFTMRALAYTNNSISLTVDLLLAIMPIPMIWRLQVKVHVKVAIGIVMSLGALAAAACVFRMHYLSSSSRSGDDLFDSITWTIWTAVECNIAVIAASVPSIIPLIKRCNEIVRYSARIAMTNAIETSRLNIQGANQGFQLSPIGEAVMNRTDSVRRGSLVAKRKPAMKLDLEGLPTIMVQPVQFSPPEQDYEDASKLYADFARQT